MLSSKEMEEAIALWENHKPKIPVREELGGDYYYRCGWLSCNQVIKHEWVACPYCGQAIRWEDDYVG